MFRGASLIRNTATLGTYGRTMARALWWSRAGHDVEGLSVPDPPGSSSSFSSLSLSSLKLRTTII